MFKIKQHIFFDLDRTLWDFDTNSRDTFTDIFQIYEIEKKGKVDFDALYSDYQIINHELWDQYRKGEIEKSFLNIERFHRALLLHGIDNRTMAAEIGKKYLEISPRKKVLFPGTHELLMYLKNKGYHLHIITNGFPEVQHIKLVESNLIQYFELVIISEEVGFKKPSLEIFEIALQYAKTTASESVMIGDDPLVDIQGAVNAGFSAIFVNHNNDPACDFCDNTVNSLMELTDYF